MSEFNKSDIRKLDTGLLLIFKELVELRNGKEVAEKLCLSQSAVSHALKRLRNVFGGPLFERKPHGLEPTAQAMTLYFQIKKILDLTEKLLGASNEFDPVSARRLFTIAAPEYVTALLAGLLVKSWRKLSSNVSVRYEHLSSAHALERVKTGAIDIALGRFEEPHAAGLKLDPVYQDSFCVVARKKHPRIKGSITRNQYEAESHVLASSSSEVTIKESSSIPKMASCIVVESWLTALKITSETDGLATCHRKLAQGLAKKFHLQVLDPPFDPYQFTISTVSRAEPDSGAQWLQNQINICVSNL